MSETSSESPTINEAVPDVQIPNQATETSIITSTLSRKKRNVCKCGECGAIGHDRRTCPQLGKNKTKNQKRSQIQQRRHPEVQSRPTNRPPDVMERCYYVVFDIETTGFSIQRNEIIQIAAKIIDNNGFELEDGSFSSLVKPKCLINHIISSLTGITNEQVKNEESIEIVLKKFINFIHQTLSFSSKFDKEDMTIDESFQHVQGKTVILVAHNGNRFDIPFLMSKMPAGVVS